MKKRFAGFLVVWLTVAAVMAGCGGGTGADGKDGDTAGEAAQTPEVTEEAPSDIGEQEEHTEAGVEEEEKESGEMDSSGQDPAAETEEKEETALAVPSVTGALHVEGTQLVDSSGEPVQLRGVSTHGLAWFPDYVNEECFSQLRWEWNANVVRLAMYTAENGGYCEGGDQQALKQLIQDGVSYATDQDLYVIVDWHILHDLTPAKYQDQAIAFFDEMSAKFAGQDNVLYEICNEPNGGTSWSEVKAYAEKVIPVIRANDEDAVILVGTPNWSQYVDQAAADPITDYDNVMYTLHFYAATHTDDLRNKMEEAVQAGLPIFVSEYGICDASGNGAIDEEQADRWVEKMNEYGISYVLWNLSNKAESSSIFASSCSKVRDFEESDLSQCGRWLCGMLAKAVESDGSDGFSAASSGSTETGKTSGKNPSGQASSGGGSGKADPTGSGQTSASGAVVLKSGSLEFTVTVKNSWEDGGKTVCQYEMTVKNTSDRACTGWSAEIPFHEAITLSDGWNGDYTAEGKTLHITAKDYNSEIPAGGSVGDVGFIVSGGEGIVEE